MPAQLARGGLPSAERFRSRGQSGVHAKVVQQAVIRQAHQVAAVPVTRLLQWPRLESYFVQCEGLKLWPHFVVSEFERCRERRRPVQLEHAIRLGLAHRRRARRCRGRRGHARLSCSRLAERIFSGAVEQGRCRRQSNRHRGNTLRKLSPADFSHDSSNCRQTFPV